MEGNSQFSSYLQGVGPGMFSYNMSAAAGVLLLLECCCCSAALRPLQQRRPRDSPSLKGCKCVLCVEPRSTTPAQDGGGRGLEEHCLVHVGPACSHLHTLWTAATVWPALLNHRAFWGKDRGACCTDSLPSALGLSGM
jgi:hypothetical protein